MIPLRCMPSLIAVSCLLLLMFVSRYVSLLRVSLRVVLITSRCKSLLRAQFLRVASSMVPFVAVMLVLGGDHVRVHILVEGVFPRIVSSVVLLFPSPTLGYLRWSSSQLNLAGVVYVGGSWVLGRLACKFWVAGCLVCSSWVTGVLANMSLVVRHLAYRSWVLACLLSRSWMLDRGTLVTGHLAGSSLWFVKVCVCQAVPFLSSPCSALGSAPGPSLV